MNAILERAQQIQQELINWRRYIHENPELGMEQPKTCALVTKVLKEMNLEPKAVGGGVVVLIKGSKPGPTILLRGDMDALPMEEESGLDFASKVKGAAHTCGHDIHTAMLLGAAKLLSENKENINGTVKLMFQPGEEVGAGAISMIREGLLEDPKVDAAMGIHTIVASDAPSGTICVSPGTQLSSNDMLRINVHGKGAHGSRPEAGIDPVNILCHIHTTLQTINSRESPQKEPAVLTIGQLNTGSAPNIIPDSGFMTGTLRTFNGDVRQLFKKRIREISEGIAQTLGGSAEVVFSSEMPSLQNDLEVTTDMIQYLKEMLGEERVVPMPSRMASEDFAEVTTRVPSIFLRLSMGSQEEGYCYDGHHPKVVFNEDAMSVGAATYAYGALRWLEEHSK